ncbi:MAG: hypothetical protein M3Q08_14090, partial [Pseudomonadota bacterium]|nr:hypothetical protein [Pseudomonadota bacterium]
MAEEGEERVVRRRISNRRILAASLILVLVIAVLTIWLARISIATRFIEREFERRDVQASYTVTRIGFRTQRIENLVVGDPKRPDLTARSVEVDVALGWRQVRASLITARGVRLFGRIENGKLRLGELDKLMPPPTGRPFRLPNQRIDVADASIRLQTPAGVIGGSIEGRGNLAFSFEGKIAAASRQLQLGDDCRLDAPVLFAEVRTEEERPSFRGPLKAARLACDGVELTRPVFTLETTLAPGFDGARGNSGIAVAELESGGNVLRRLEGRISFEGGANDLRGRMDLAARGTSVGGYRTGPARISGRYALAPRLGNASLLADLSAAGISGGEGNLRPIAEALDAGGGTPVEPVADAVAAALARAGQAFDARASLRLVSRSGSGAVRIERLRAVSRSGAAVELSGGDGLNLRWPRGATRIDGNVVLSGGGLPYTRLSLTQQRAGGPIRGVARIAPMAAGGAALRLADVRFTAGGGGATRIDTAATLSGPFNDGRVDDLVIPVSGRFGGGGFAFGEACTPVRFGALRAGGLRLGATSLRLCPDGRALVWRTGRGSLQGGALVRHPRLAGRLGQAPITFAANQVRFGLADPGFASSGVAIRLGRPGAVNRLDLASLSGSFNAQGVVGAYSGGDAKLAAVPLLLSNARGGWSVLGGDVKVGGALTVSDAAELPRFHALITDGFQLTLDDGRIDAG